MADSDTTDDDSTDSQPDRTELETAKAIVDEAIGRGISRRALMLAAAAGVSGAALGTLGGRASAASPSNASGTVYFEQIGDSNNPVEEVYINNQIVSQTSISPDEINSVNQIRTSDDIQSEIDAEGARTRHVLAAGDHTISSEILVNYDEVELVGPREAVIKFSSSTEDTVIRVGKDTSISHFLAQGITIDASNQTQPADLTAGSATTKDGVGILIDEDDSSVDVDDYIIQQVKFVNTKNEAIGHVDDGSGGAVNDSHGLVIGCLFDGCEGYAAIHCHNDNSGTWAFNRFRDLSSIRHVIRHGWAVYNVFENCSMNGNGTPDTMIIGSNNSGQISHNYILRCSGTNAIESWTNLEKISNNTLIDNTFAAEIVDRGDGAEIIGNYSRNADNNCIQVSVGEGIIVNNTVENAGNIGIEIKTPYIVSDNYVKNSSDNGIRVDAADTTVTDNVVREARFGINVTTGDCVIRGNTVTNTNFDGILVRPGSSDTDVLHNEVRDVASGRRGIATAASNCRVIGNRVRGSSNDDGIYVAGSGSEVLYNDAVDGGGSAYNFADQNILARHNIGHDGDTTLSSDGGINWHDEIVILDASSSSVTATLPDPTQWEGFEIRVLATDSTNAAELSNNGNENINGSTSNVSIDNAYDQIVLVSDGSDWFAREMSAAS